MSWLSEAIRCLETGEAAVLVTVAGTRGSAPRPAGTKMLVSDVGTVGSVGGGELERRALERARGLLAEGPKRRHELEGRDPVADKCGGAVVDLVFERLEAADLPALETCRREFAGAGALLLTPLDDLSAPWRAWPVAEAPAELLEALGAGRDAAVVTLAGTGLHLLERLRDRRPRIWLFGAGHVGQALARALAPLPVHLTWVDDRAALLPAEASDALTPLLSAAPAREVAGAPPGALVLTMSHNHELDFEITEAALRRGDLGFVGLIGSDGKKARFLARAAANGLGEAALARLVCPIGLPTIEGREPAVIAASVTAQLLEAAEAQAGPGEASA